MIIYFLELIKQQYSKQLIKPSLGGGYELHDMSS